MNGGSGERGGSEPRRSGGDPVAESFGWAPTGRAERPGPGSGPPGHGPGRPPGYGQQPPGYGQQPPGYGPGPGTGPPPGYGPPAGPYGPQQNFYGPIPGSQVPGTAGPGRPPRRGRTALIVVLCVVAVLVAGGVVAASTGVVDRLLPAEPAPAVAAPPSLIGDPRTADPCSLITESSVRKFGRPETVTDRGWPNGCGIELSSDGPGFLSLTATLAAADPSAPPQGTPTQSGALTVYRESADSGLCRRTVTTQDGTWVYVTGESAQGGKGDLCAIADAGTSSTVAALAAGQLPRRPATETPSRLTGLDMCAVADAGVASRLQGVDTFRRQPGFGNWSCYWGYDPAFSYSPTVYVSMGRYSRLTGTPTRIGGRAGQVSPATTSGDTSCSVELVQRTFTTPGGAPRVEVVTVQAYAGRQPNTDASCRGARAVAEALAPKLPPAS